MNARLLSNEYIEGAKSFIKFTQLCLGEKSSLRVIMISLAIMTREVIPTNQVIPISPTISIWTNLLRIATQNLEIQRSKLNLTMTINQLEIMRLHLLPLWERKQDRSAHLIMQNGLLCLDQQKDSFGRLFGEYELEDKREVFVMSKANSVWKNWKHTLRLDFDKYTTDSDRRKNRPMNMKPDDWVRFIRQCHTEEEKAKREQGKLVRTSVKLPHTSGRRGAARTKQELMKQSETGEVTRTELFMALHTKKDGSCPLPEARPTLDVIRQVVSLCPSSINKDLDNDPVAEVCCRDGNRCVRGYPSGVSNTVLHAAAPYKKWHNEKKENEKTLRRI